MYILLMKVYKYRIYPRHEQEVLLNKHMGCSRFIYNWGLNLKTKEYARGNKLTCIDMMYLLPKLKEEFPWLKEVNAQTLQMSLRNLDNAYKRFFREKKGFPKFKSKKNNKKSFQCCQNNRVDFDKSLTYLIKFKEGIKTVFHRKFEGKIKTTTISKTCSGKYFVSILVDNGVEYSKSTKVSKAIGVDFGLTTFATLSTGEKIENPKYLRKNLNKVKKLCKQLSNKKLGSKNRNKVRIKLARLYEKITNQREDFLHKFSHKLVCENQADTICLEDLSVKNMMKNHSLALSISDVGWGKCIQYIKYKCEWYGKNLIQIGKFDPSSKLCTCGQINQNLTIKDREWTCVHCGTLHDRDILAANNIVKFALIKSGTDGAVETVETSVVREVVETVNSIGDNRNLCL